MQSCCARLTSAFVIIVALDFPGIYSLVPFSHKTLKNSFNKDLVGQHIAAQIITQKFQAYYDMNDLNLAYERYGTPAFYFDACRPLTFSFHGMSGVGKTFVTNLIYQSFESAHVHLVSFPPIISPALQYEVMVKQVKNNLYSSYANIFIIEAIERAPEGVIEGLSNLIRDFSTNCKSGYQIIFLLQSYIYSEEINRLYANLLSTSKVNVREELEAIHFESIFDKKNQWYDDMVEKGQVDAFVPFLPLEKDHVVQCIKRELRLKGLPVIRQLVDAVLEQLNFFTVGELEFSVTGCKRVGDKVDFIKYHTEL